MMKIALLCIGKTNEKYLETGIDIYIKRLSHYCTFNYQEIKDVKSTTDAQALKNAEAKQFLQYIESNDYVVLLDENGKTFTSVAFAKWIEQAQINSTKRIIFIIGGAYGFGQELIDRANAKMSLSPLTFSHQMVRLFFTEQLYRAYTIIKGEKYHNP